MKISNFISDESGAVTVDWVVLTAAIVGIAIAVLTLIAVGIGSSSETTNTQVASADSVSGLIGGRDASSFGPDQYEENFGSYVFDHFYDDTEHEVYRNEDTETDTWVPEGGGTVYEYEYNTSNDPYEVGSADENGNVTYNN